MFQFQWAAYVVGKYVVSPGGVVQLYKASLKYSSEEIKRALTLFTDETHFPIHVHCSHGKDRTGMVVALVLAICGVPEEQIVLDYAKSEAGLAPVHDALAKDIQRSGLSDEFMHTPPQNMRDLFNYLKKQYGSIPEYLESIGFDTKAQEKVRSILCASLPKA
ncbi:hypothetical protein DM01DRAFT_1288879 [Hesseltinella vesiculosa]|uniref:Tyrosine specific protein phosphatases domain-containing protein n=1 Tax=Hesseltinella vesiculosa TaxID=101127 RepID=A0A1X2GFG2_9FUNG|nr:hypothetical protein DM01DRAFT_1288879 [Hesseltinella vesiculosa]